MAICAAGGESPVLVRPGHIWSRADVLAWIERELPDDSLVGLDLGASLPFVDEGAFFPGWEASPADARGLWALVDAICADEPHLGANAFVDHPEASRHFRRHGARAGDLFPAGMGRLRVTELAQRAEGLRPVSNLNLVGAAQVGKSSLTGMRVLHRLSGRIAVWPFDPVPARGSVVVEIYTAVAAGFAGLPKGRTKVRDPETLDAALAALGSRPHRALDRYDDHATDAIMAAAWMRSVAHDPALWAPPELTTNLARTEGWTFGIRRSIIR